MDAMATAQFWIVAVLLVLTPGADWAFAIAAGLRERSAAPSVLGIVAGYAVVVVAVAVGVGALVAQHPVALTAMTFAGAGYLVLLGVSALRRRAEPPAETAGSPALALSPEHGGRLRATSAGQFLRGMGVSTLNPKGLLLLLALLPQFASPAAAWPPTVQMLVLGALHVLDCAVVYFLVAVLARRLLGSRPRATAIVSRVSGFLMTGIGLFLVVETLLSRVLA